MDLQPGSTTRAAHPSTRQGPEVRLQGVWLILARSVWVVLALLAIGLLVASLPSYYAYLHIINTTSVYGPQLTPGDVQELHNLGLSLNFYAWLNISVFLIFLLMLPISIAIAILRSRLWDIDTIINKALVYGSLTALLAAVYAGLIIGLESLAGLFSRQSTQPPVIVVSTLAIAALFQPLRSRIQRLIDRRFYRRKYDAVRTLEAFSATLRNEVDLATLSEQLLGIVEETMQPAHVSLWLCKGTNNKTNTDA
jgi:hypothetical protein